MQGELVGEIPVSTPSWPGTFRHCNCKYYRRADAHLVNWKKKESRSMDGNRERKNLKLKPGARRYRDHKWGADVQANRRADNRRQYIKRCMKRRCPPELVHGVQFLGNHAFRHLCASRVRQLASAGRPGRSAPPVSPAGFSAGCQVPPPPFFRGPRLAGCFLLVHRPFFRSFIRLFVCLFVFSCVFV